MNITTNRLELLVTIGRHPDYSLEELAKEIGWKKGKVNVQLNHLREHGLIVRAEGDDRKEGLEWELTGEGHGEVIEKVEEVEEVLDTVVMKPLLFTYKPPHARGESGKKFVGDEVAAILNEYGVSGTEGENILKAFSFIDHTLSSNGFSSEEKKELLENLLKEVEGIEIK